MRILPNYRSRLGFTPMDVTVTPHFAPAGGAQPAGGAAPAGGEAAEAAPAEGMVPGVFPANTPVYLYPTTGEVPTQQQPAAAPAEGISTKTLLIGGGILIAGVAIIALVTR